MFKYKTENLYIGVLGYVTESKDKYLHIDRSDIVIIFDKEDLHFGDYCAKELFSGQVYYFFKGNRFDSKTIRKAINDYAIFSAIPLSGLTSKNKLTKKELLKITQDMKQKIKTSEHISNEKTIEVTDSILTMILETSNKVKNASIEPTTKAKLLKELKELSENYVNEMSKKSESNPQKTISENEYTMKMQTLKKLVDIAENYQKPQSIKKLTRIKKN